ncbi:glutathione S-transferase family protein [Vibrio nitrifigilis]|uniref:Glutathione S-transferase family protein n=1 Tax=Vibrio nitrifigilis TaxID=2789781 RepID=A0ABS0GDS8_9VIBR|nr:glutathione S-transferase family protein [Vibrio nitrifigilis]MBF9000562.1 glutathione S-transferase family protein [Vibrio nitrifigilis]
MKLIGMLDSPFVRRVAVSLAMYEIEFESLPLSVFGDFARFSEYNPVVKAPTLVFDDGTRLLDSTLILNYFESLADDFHALMPSDPAKLASDLSILGLILAASEKAVQNVYEHKLRPDEKQHQPWIERVTKQLNAACHEWEIALSNRPLSEKADQVSITSTVIWSFIQLMIPDVIKASDYPTINAIANHFEATPEFKRFPLK